jgi:hypothetical protein
MHELVDLPGQYALDRIAEYQNLSYLKYGMQILPDWFLWGFRLQLCRQE